MLLEKIDERLFREIEIIVKKKLPDTIIEINTSAPPDKRSYKVDFSLFKNLANGFDPIYNLEKSISGLINGLNDVKFQDINFRDSDLIRLNHLKKIKLTKKVDESLYLIKS